MSIVAYAHSTLLTHFLSYKLLRSEFNIYRKDVIDIHFLFIFAVIFTWREDIKPYIWILLTYLKK